MKKIKLLSAWIYEGKKYNPGDVVEVPDKVYNHLKETNKKKGKAVVIFEDFTEEVKK